MVVAKIVLNLIAIFMLNIKTSRAICNLCLSFSSIALIS